MIIRIVTSAARCAAAYIRWMYPVVGIALVCGLQAEGVAAQAKVGNPAPEFSVSDTRGRSISLSDFRGRYVVLEWFNHDCPFVQKHYTSSNMQQLQLTYTSKDVAWLSINSSAPGKQGHVLPEDAEALMEEKGAKPTAVLLDPDGRVGRLYGAKTTPHMFIVDPDGIVIYAGAIDDTPSMNVADVPGATNYVANALDEAMAGLPVSVAEAKSYGCSVKY